MEPKHTVFILFALIFTGCTNLKKGKSTPKEMNGPSVSIGDNSRNAVDWHGTYRGTLPCADCNGIKSEITLRSDLTYDMAQQYQGKSDDIIRFRGKFEWDGSGSKITLLDAEKSSIKSQFLVGENRLIKLDRNGTRIEGALSERYQLKKVGNDSKIVDKYWKLVKLHGKTITRGNDQNKEAHFILVPKDHRVQGNGGCNLFNGGYKLSEGNHITFSPLAVTQMACLNIEDEDVFLKIFEQVDNYSVAGDTLSLNKARMAPLAQFELVYFK